LLRALAQLAVDFFLRLPDEFDEPRVVVGIQSAPDAREALARHAYVGAGRARLIDHRIVDVRIRLDVRPRVRHGVRAVGFRSRVSYVYNGDFHLNPLASALDRADHNALDEVFLNERVDQEYRYGRFYETIDKPFIIK